jgi:hypothetical protein
MRPLYIFLIFGLVLSILFSSGQVENPDTQLRLTQTRIILDDHRFGLPEDVGEDMHGNIAINEDGQRYMVYMDNPEHADPPGTELIRERSCSGYLIYTDNPADADPLCNP